MSVDSLWPLGLDWREEAVLRARPQQTLDAIGAWMGLSRERVRQLEARGRKCLIDTLQEHIPEAFLALSEVFAKELAVDNTEVCEFLSSAQAYRREVVLHAFGAHRLVVWGQSIDGWWTTRPEVARDALTTLVAAAPFPLGELQARSAAVGLPARFPTAMALEGPKSPVKLHSRGGWFVRKSAAQRDAAYLWLLETGQPRAASDISMRLGMGRVNATREQLRRDERFVQLRPAGTWALAEWNLPKAGVYRSALEAVAAILSAQGPLAYEDLLREMRTVYPVSNWRVSQCLESNRIGFMPDGRVGLVSDGAILVEEAEPPKPSNVAVSEDEQLVAVRLTVNHDMLRGSGLPLPKYVAWRAGLAGAPQSRSFVVAGEDEAITVTRNLGGVSATALRRFVEPFGVVQGCVLVLLLRLDRDSARLIHGCQASSCPAYCEGD